MLFFLQCYFDTFMYYSIAIITIFITLYIYSKNSIYHTLYLYGLFNTCYKVCTLKIINLISPPPSPVTIILLFFFFMQLMFLDSTVISYSTCLSLSDLSHLV